MSFLKRAISKAKGRLGPPLPIRGGKPPVQIMPIRPPSAGRPRPPISIGRPPSIGRPINIGRPVAPPGGIRPLPIRPPSIGRPIPPISIGGPGGGRPMPINVPGGGGIDYGGGEGPPLLPLQPPSIGGPINVGTPITGQPLVPGSGNVPPIQDDGLVTDPYGNRIDPNNLPDNMVLEDGGLKGGMRAVFAPDYALQPNDPGYMSNDRGGNRGIEQIIRPPSIGGPGGGITSIGQIGQDPSIPRMINENPIPFDPGQPLRNEIGPIGGSDEIIPNVSAGSGFFDDPLIPSMGNENPIPFDPTKPLGPGDPGYIDTGSLLPKLPGGPNQPKPVGLPDYGFGPGIRPSEIITPDGQFIGSGGVTPPGGTIRTMDFQDTDMNGVDDRDQPDFGGPSQEYLDQQERIKQIFNPGTTPPIPDPTPDPVTTPAPVIPPEPVTPPVSTTVAANQPTEAPVTDPAPVVEPSPTQTTAPPQVPGETPFAAGVTQIQSGLDPLTEQLLFGLGGQGGFIPGAMRAAEKVFYDDQGQPVVIDEQVAGFSPDQLAAMQLQRQSIGMQQPYLDQATQSYFSGLGALQSGVGESLNTAAQGVEDIARGVGESRAMREAGLRGLVGSLDEARGLSRGATDEFGRRISGVEAGSQRAAGQFARGLGRSQFGLERGVDQFGNRLTDVEGLQRGATDQFGRRTAGIAGRGMSDVGRFEQGLRDPESLLRGTVGGYDQGMTEQFYDPYEDRVVQQTIEDIMEQGAKSDIGARAGDIARGGESAFGSRARLGAGERTEALGRGLAEALGGIRSSGFQRAQQAGMSEFARQKQAERAAASGLSDLASQRLGAGQNLSGMLANLSGQQLGAQQALASGLGSLAGQRLGAGQSLAEFQRGTAGQQLASQQALQNMLRGTSAERLAAKQNLGATLAGLGTTQQQALSQAGQQALAGQQVLGGARTGLAGMQMGAGQALQQGQFGLGSSLQGLGAQAAGASASDIASLYGMGSQQQGITQAMLDAQRRNMQQRQMTPLLQYQALAPFVGMAPAGQFQTTTQFAPKPSAMQAGLGTGLAAFGALGQLYGGQS